MNKKAYRNNIDKKLIKHLTNQTELTYFAKVIHQNIKKMAKKNYYYVATADEGHYQKPDSFAWLIEAPNKKHLNTKLDWMRFPNKKEAMAFINDKLPGMKVKQK